MVKAVRYFLLLSLFILGGCNEERVSGGTTETENAIVARVYRIDSLLSDWNRPQGMPTVATLRLDSSNFDFAGLDTLGRDIDIRKLDGTHVPFAIDYWNPMQREGRLQIRIGWDLRWPDSRIALWKGLALRQRTDSATTLWAGITDSLKLALTSVLVDDFENEISRSWFLGTGSGAVTAGAGREGNALHLIASGTTPVVLAAALLAPTPRRLGSLDSIVFWARGQGSLRIAFEHAMPGVQKVAWSPRNLNAAWQRIKVTPADLDSALSGRDAVSWGAIQDSVSHLSFWLDGAGEGWIDEPRLFGVDRDDFQ